MITTTSFKELLATYNKKGTYIDTGFDPVTLLRYVKRIEKVKFDKGNGNIYNAGVVIQHFENTNISITASMPRLVDTWKPSIVPGLVLHGTSFFKGMLLKDQDGKRVPVANLPEGAFIEYNNKFMQLPVNNTHVLLNSDATLEDLITEFPQTALAIPDRKARKVSRNKITEQISTIKAETLIGAFDLNQLAVEVKQYHRCYNAKDFIAEGLDLSLAVNSVLGRLAIAYYEKFLTYNQLRNISEQCPEISNINASTITWLVERFANILCERMVGIETQPKYIDYFTAEDKPEK